MSFVFLYAKSSSIIDLQQINFFIENSNKKAVLFFIRETKLLKTN